MLNPVTGDLFNGTQAIEARYNGGERFFDATGIAFNDPTGGFDSTTHPVTLVTLAIEDNGPNGYLNFYTIDKDGKGTRVNTQPGMAGMRDARCLYLPPTTLPDDPDADAMADAAADPPGPPLLAQNTPVAYGGVRDRNVVYVWAWSRWPEVKGPENWTGYNGIEIDPYYLWVFGKGGIACATHASMIKCRQGKIARPSWIHYNFDEQVAEREVTALSPCADGTLLVGTPGEIYTCDYHIDRKAGRIVTSSWVKRGGNAKQVIKMPIPAWSVLESLRANLESE